MARQIFDFGCKLTGTKCGENMIYMPYIWFDTIKNSSWHRSCNQSCVCTIDHNEKNEENCRTTNDATAQAQLSTAIFSHITIYSSPFFIAWKHIVFKKETMN